MSEVLTHLLQAKETLHSMRSSQTRRVLGFEHDQAVKNVRNAVGAIQFDPDVGAVSADMTAVAKMAFATAAIIGRAIVNTDDEYMRENGGNLLASMTTFALICAPEGSRLRQAVQRRFPQP